MEEVWKQYRNTRYEISTRERERVSKLALRNNENRKKVLSVLEKDTRYTHEFKSAIEASEYYNRYKGYFSELITKRGGENHRYSAKYT